MQGLISQDTPAEVWSGCSACLPCGAEFSFLLCYLRKLPRKAVKQLVSWTVICENASYIFGCDHKVVHCFETASVAVDSAGERHVRGLAEICLKDGMSHMWGTVCVPSVQYFGCHPVTKIRAQTFLVDCLLWRVSGI